MALGPKEQEIMRFLHERIFDPILSSPKASASLKQGVRLTINRMERLDAAGIVQYYWSARCCQSNANSSLAGAAVAGDVRPQLMTDCHSARAAERLAL